LTGSWEPVVFAERIVYEYYIIYMSQLPPHFTESRTGSALLTEVIILQCPSSTNPLVSSKGHYDRERAPHELPQAVAGSFMRVVIVPSRLKCLDICFTCFLGDWIIAECLALAFLKPFFSLLQHLKPFVLPLALHCRCGPTRFEKDLQNLLFTLDLLFQG